MSVLKSYFEEDLQTQNKSFSLERCWSRTLHNRFSTDDYLIVENKIGDLFSTLRSAEK